MGSSRRKQPSKERNQRLTQGTKQILNGGPEVSQSIPSKSPSQVAQPTILFQPVFAISDEGILSSSRRIGSLAAPPTYEDVLGALLAVDVADDGAMELFVQINRDLLDYRFLYRLTADKLLAENTGDVGHAAALQAARVQAVQFAQRFDAPLFQEVGAAESRLGAVLAQHSQGEPPQQSAVVDACGGTPTAAFAFWFVTIAAMAAWEAKLNVTAITYQAEEKLHQLATVRATLESDALSLTQECGVASLAPLLALPNLAAAELTPTKREFVRLKLNEVAPDAIEALALVRRIGCTYCQASRHGFKAYNPAVQQMATLYDVLLHGDPQPLVGWDVQAPRRLPESQMVQMANDADKVLGMAGVQTALFW